MTDIWDEKPISHPPCYSYVFTYSAEEVDAWLEKVKEYWDNTMEINRKQFHEIGRLEKELHGLQGSAKT